MRGGYRQVLSVVGVLLIVAGLMTLPHQAVQAAAPWIIIVHGERLDQPVTVTDIDLNARILGSPVASNQPVDLSERPYFDLALFWGPDWLDFIELGESPDALTPDQANQRGRFYPAFGSAEAIVVLEAPSTLSPAPPASRPSQEGLELLQARGIPIRLDADSPSWTSALREPLLWGLGLTVILLGGAIAAARARDPERKLGPDASYGYR